MNNTMIDIVLTGELAEGISFEQACATVEKLFKLPAEQAKQLLETSPRVIKRGLDSETAEKYRQTIEKNGLKVIFKSDDAAASIEPAAPAPISAVAPAMVATTPCGSNTTSHSQTRSRCHIEYKQRGTSSASSINRILRSEIQD